MVASNNAVPLPLRAALGSPGADRTRAWSFVVLGAVVLIAPAFIYPIFLMKVLCFALFASAFNLLLGYGGLLSFGHAAYFGAASYVTAYAAKVWGFPPEASILTGVLAATLMGAAFGAIAIRRQGIYFAMITLALAQLTYFFAVQTPGFTGGENGLQDVPRGRLFGWIGLDDDMALYAVVAVIFMACVLFIERVVGSPFGQVLKAIRDNEPRAISLGYQTSRYKLLAFVLSTALAGLAGSLKAIIFQVATLTDVHWSMSGEPVLMTLLGGLGTTFGPMLGAAIIIAMQDYLAHLGGWITVIQGGVFVLCVLLFRRGIVGTLGALARKQRMP